MKSTNSLLLGLASSLLLTVGLTRAAERFDVSHSHALKTQADLSKSAAVVNGLSRPAPSCTSPCACDC